MASTGSRQRFFFRAIALCASIALLAAVAEVLLRVSGFPPAAPSLRAGEPVVQEPHPTLGWRNKAGEYALAPYTPAGSPIHMRFLGRGRRATSAATTLEASGERPSLIIVGGSFAQGWAISDDETFAWELQARYPEFEVLNYGTGGYGSYQSLLTLEAELPELRDPRLVLYAFTGHHDVRSVAPWHWMKLLSDLSQRGHIDVPHATLGSDGKLVRHAPARYREWPGSPWLALPEFLHTRLLGLAGRLGRGREADARAVSKRVLLAMNELSRSRGAHFVVALLSARQEKAKAYEAFLGREGIAVVNCNAFPLPRKMIVAGEGHPNGAMNSRWSDCIGDFLERDFELRRSQGAVD